MTYPSLTEGIHQGEYLISEGNGSISREAVIIAAGSSLSAGTILGQILRGAETSATGTNTGNGILGTVTLGVGSQPGIYALKITKAAANAGDFEVTDPEGELVGVGTVGLAFNAGGLSFTLADGATDFVVGDSFALTVGTGSMKHVQLNPAAADGSQHAAGILFGHVNALTGDAKGAKTARLAEVQPDMLTWPVGITGPQQAQATADLAALFIILRPQ